MNVESGRPLSSRTEDNISPEPKTSQNTAVIQTASWNDCQSDNLHRVSKKQAKLFLLQLRQTSIKSDNFWHKDGKQSNIIWGALIFHLT